MCSKCDKDSWISQEGWFWEAAGLNLMHSFWQQACFKAFVRDMWLNVSRYFNIQDTWLHMTDLNMLLDVRKSAPKVQNALCK